MVKEVIEQKILSKLKEAGLKETIKVIKKNQNIDYLNLILEITSFIEKNHKIVKNLTQEQRENVILLCIQEVFDELEDLIDNDEVDKILLLLKNSMMTKRLIKESFKLCGCTKKPVEKVVLKKTLQQSA